MVVNIPLRTVYSNVALQIPSRVLFNSNHQRDSDKRGRFIYQPPPSILPIYILANSDDEQLKLPVAYLHSHIFDIREQTRETEYLSPNGIQKNLLGNFACNNQESQNGKFNLQRHSRD